jgi:hypothetical protein
MFDFGRSPPPTIKILVSSSDNPGDCRFQFDASNKILLACFEGRLTDELAVKGYEEMRKRGIQTDACVIIADMSSVTTCAAQPFVIRSLSRRASVLPDPKKNRFMVVRTTAAFGLARMFQLAGEPEQPKIEIVRTLAEVWAALGIEPPRFETLP